MFLDDRIYETVITHNSKEAVEKVIDMLKVEYDKNGF